MNHRERTLDREKWKGETEEEGFTEAEVEDGEMKPQEGEIKIKDGLKEEEMEVILDRITVEEEEMIPEGGGGTDLVTLKNNNNWTKNNNHQNQVKYYSQ